MAQTKTYEAIIIGGSYAGMSAALALGRSLRHTLIIDSGRPCNAPTPHSHNFLTRDGSTPQEIASLAKEQLDRYASLDFFKGLAEQAIKTGDGFEIQTQSRDRFFGKKLIFATGIRDRMPEIKGFSDCWGKSVIHCPYCHGYEFRNKRTGILAPSEKAYHLAMLVRNLTPELTLYTDPSGFSPEQFQKLKVHGIKIDSRKILELQHHQGQLQKLIFSDGIQELEALYAGLPFEQHSKLPMELGCSLDQQGYLQTDMLQRCTVGGIYACGDNSSGMRSLAQAVHSGNMAGAAVNGELASEYF